MKPWGWLNYSRSSPNHSKGVLSSDSLLGRQPVLRTIASVMSLAVLASCSPATETVDPVTPETSDLTRVDQPSERVAKMPPIGELETCSFDFLFEKDGAATDCLIDQDGLSVSVNYSEMVDGEGNVAVRVLSEDGMSVVQTLGPETAFNLYFPPEIVDFDGDGDQDILVTTEVGNVNGVQSVWLQGAKGGFSKIGAISGVSSEITTDGLIAVSGRSAANAWEINYYDLSDGTLDNYVIVAVESDGESSTCAVQTVAGNFDLGLNESEMNTKFCNEPSAQIFTPPAYFGTWGRSAQQCEKFQEVEEAPLILTEQGLDQYETHCYFTEIDQKSDTDWLMSASCSVQGDEQETDIRLTIFGDKLAINYSGGENTPERLMMKCL